MYICTIIPTDTWRSSGPKNCVCVFVCLFVKDELLPSSFALLAELCAELRTHRCRLRVALE
jgi:hypothetical protein